MGEVRVGDKVLALSGDGRLIYDDVFFIGHQDANTMSLFVEISLLASRVLYLSGGHFIPVASDGSQPYNRAVMKRAEDVQVGDWVWGTAASNNDTSSSSAMLSQVVSVAHRYKKGLYNPHTLSGTIVVDGILASTHSDWFLDGMLPMAFTRHLPTIYQAVLAPARTLYHLMGPHHAQTFQAKYCDGEAAQGSTMVAFLSLVVRAVGHWLMASGGHGAE